MSDNSRANAIDRDVSAASNISFTISPNMDERGPNSPSGRVSLAKSPVNEALPRATASHWTGPGRPPSLLRMMMLHQPSATLSALAASELMPPPPPPPLLIRSAKPSQSGQSTLHGRRGYRGAFAFVPHGASHPPHSLINARPPAPALNGRHQPNAAAGAAVPYAAATEIEFDGTSVLCRVCGDKASGFHYGVHSCEGCKGFFRRSIQQKIQYRPCTKNQQCAILRVNRNRCQYCRLKKCVNVGMSRDAVRFGRVPKREKARILAAMRQNTVAAIASGEVETDASATAESEQGLLSTVVAAHRETCDFTPEKVAPMLQNARQNPRYATAPASVNFPSLACPLNPNSQPLSCQQELMRDFSKRFSPAIRGVVEFAKKITGFQLLPQDDQVTLLKAGVFEVLLVRLTCMFDSETNNMMCLNGSVLRREAIKSNTKARFLMDSMFEFAEQINSMKLTDSEVALFSSIVVIASDRPGLKNVELIKKLNARLRNLLALTLRENHPNQPQLYSTLTSKVQHLRTLNSLHSEKLLAFKMGEAGANAIRQQWAETNEIVDNCSVLSAGSVQIGADENEKEAEADCPPIIIDAEPLETSASVAPPPSPPPPPPAPAVVIALPKASSNQRATSCPLPIPVAQSHIPEEETIGANGRACRKVDSPSDSGIESGTEKVCCNAEPTGAPVDQQTKVAASTCSDMPVLKRVLQAPPLYDTNSLMDEAYAYKAHKKFRALRQSEPDSRDASQLEYHVATPPLSTPIPASSLSSTHSTLAKSLMEGPRMTAEQIKRTDIIHNFIMKRAIVDESSNNNNNGGASPSTLSTSHSYYVPQAKWRRTSLAQHAGLQSTAVTYDNRQLLSANTSYSSSSPTTLVACSPVQAATIHQMLNSQQPLNLSKKTTIALPAQMRV